MFRVQVQSEGSRVLRGNCWETELVWTTHVRVDAWAEAVVEMLELVAHGDRARIVTDDFQPV